MDRYDFNAPRFVDFTVTEEDDREDDYFGTIQNGVTATKTEADNCNSVRATDDLAMECKTSSPPLQVATDVEDDLARTMEVLHVSEQTPSAKRFSSKKGMPSSSDRKSHAMITRLDATTGRILEVSQALDFTQGGGLERSTADMGGTGEATSVVHSMKVVSTNSKLATAAFKHHKRVREDAHGDHRNANPQKYISMAEAILKFQLKTPKRFHSRVGGSPFPRISMIRQDPTVPHPPRLTACTRVRQVHYPSREERESMELAEMKNHKIVAQPVNPHIFQSPKLGKRVPKFTEPEPFKLTEVKKTEPETAPTYKFTAQPVPKNLLSPRPSICNVQPAVHVRRRLEHHKVFASALQENNSEDVLVQKEVFNFGVPLEIRKNTPLKRSTEVKPFSFEDRNKEVARRKEEKIKMFLEEEKQARIFHAQPLPGVYRRRMGSNPDVSIMSTASMVETGSDENKNPAVFKAHPAIVLKKEPFVPSKIDRSPLKPRNHMLKTEVRAKERKEFEEKVRAEMEELEKLRKEYEEQKHLEEEAKASAQRRLAESFRAQPVPKFKTPKKPLPRN